MTMQRGIWAVNGPWFENQSPTLFVAHIKDS
jgi:hypothetical protein